MLTKEWKLIPGWFNEAEAKVLYDLVFKIPEPATIIEIGCFRGRSTYVMLEACKDSSLFGHKKVSCVDNFSGTGSVLLDEPRDEAKIQREKETFFENIASLTNFFGQLYDLDSAEWFRRKANIRYQMFFIDGCHPMIASDVQSAWQLLMPGGLLVCHDYDISDPNSAVVREINQLLLPGKHCGVSGTSLYIVEKP